MKFSPHGCLFQSRHRHFKSKRLNFQKWFLVFKDAKNERAVHVYKKAGFEIIGEFIASWYPVQHYKMQLCIEGLKKLLVQVNLKSI